MLRRAWKFINTDAGMYSAIAALVIGGAALTVLQRNSKLSCSVGLHVCVMANGRLLPIEDAQKILDDCDEFTNQKLGLTALSMTTAEILDENQKYQSSAKGQSPLLLAHFAFERLYDSDLPFERKRASPEQRYFALANACDILARAGSDPKSYTR